MLYEIVTQGDYPYALGPMEGVAATDALLYRIQTEAPRRPAIGSAENAGALSTLISRCLVHEPDRRVQSAGQLADDLARIREQRRIVTRPLPLPYRLRRLAVGLAIHARFALCAASIFGVVLGLSLAAWLRFARWNVEDEFSYATRSRLAALSDSTRAPEFLMVGIGDGTVEVAPRIAASNGLEGVTSDVPTWRGLHGLLMERLAAAKPSLMVWDFYFRTPQAEDAAFVRGAESLRAAGAGVALAATGFSEQGPDLSAPLWQPLRDDAAAGLILARDMVERPGEFVIAVQRSDYTFPSLILSAFAALVHPGCTPDVDYSAQRSHLMLRYRQAGSPGMLAGVDEILLSRNFRQAFGNGTVRPGDVLACKIFPLSSLTYWTQRTVSYESLLRASKEEVCRLASGKIVCVIDTRGAAGGGKFDRHRVKYPQGIVENVPGGYLLADGLRNLIQGCGSQPAFPDVITFAVLLTTSVIGCVVGIPLARQPWVRTYRRQLLLALCLCIIGAASAALMLSLRTENTVQAAAGGAAALFAAALSLAIEGTRQQHRLPSRTAD
jgi:CHASE2 domain-containing sensor protein